MRSVVKSVLQIGVMAAIVATLVYLPLGALLALAAWLFGVPFPALASFDGALHPALGLLAWWLAFFLCAWTYAALAFPWEEG